MPSNTVPFYQRPASDTVYVEDTEIITRRDERACCICNSNNSICMAEQGETHFITSLAAQALAYFIT